MNISEPRAQSLSLQGHAVCSLMGQVLKTATQSRQIQSPQMLPMLLLLKTGRVKCNESQVNLKATQLAVNFND